MATMIDFDVPAPQHLETERLQFALKQTVTVLLGRNGSGKSSILRALHEHGPGDTSWSTHLVEPERGGRAQYNVNTAQNDKQWRTNTKRTSNTDGQYRSRILARLSEFLISLGVRSGRGLEGASDALQELEDVVSALALGLKIVVQEDAPYLDVSDILSGDSRVANNEIVGLSSGESEALTLIIDAFTSTWINPNTIVLLDEPDAHLNPDLVIRFASALKQVIDINGGHLVITTQRPALVSALGLCFGNKLGVGYVQPGGTAIIKKFSKEIVSLGALYGGTAMAAELGLGRPLLVEGADDEAIWTRVSRSSKFPGELIIIPSGSDSQVKQNRKHLAEHLGATREWEKGDPPLAIGLLDGDASCSQDSTSIVALVQLACRESENLLFAEETILMLGHSLEDALVELRNAAHERPEIPALADILALDRKNADVKGLVQLVAEVLDSQQRPWWRIVGDALLSSPRPNGELAGFLGPKVVSVLWSGNP